MSDASTAERGPAPDDPVQRFQAWLAEAARQEVNDPNAMTLATCAPDGRPAARIVLLKGLDARGFVFYTNLQSRKSIELTANPRAALLFHWKTLQRQVRIEGEVERVDDAEADAYFATRHRMSRIGAWASDQSRPLSARAELEQRTAAYEARFPTDDIPRPPHWSGFRLLPRAIEFWQEMPYRLHDRSFYTRTDAGWLMGKLYP